MISNIFSYSKMPSQSTPKGHAGKAVMGFIDKFYEHTPGFQVLQSLPKWTVISQFTPLCT
jgi:hypothetical protein